MANKSFDDNLKSKLESFEMKVPEQAWDDFESSKNQIEFDQAILASIDSFNLNELPADWEILEQKLTNIEADLNFDHAIESKLAGLSIEESADWNDFEKILDQEDKQFDQSVNSTLKNHEISAKENHWPKLSAHLEELEKRRKRVVYSKLAELVIFFLLLSALLQFFPSKNLKNNQVFRTEALKHQLNGNYIEEKPLSNIVEYTSNAQNGEFESNLKILDVNKIIDRSEENSLISKEIQRKSTPVATRQFFVENKNLSIQPSLLEANKPILKDQEHKIHSTAHTNNHAQFVSISTIEKASIHLSSPANDFIIPGVDKASSERFLAISTFASPDLNLINTPYDAYYGIESYQNVGLGQSIGLRLHYSKQDWEINAGLVYSSYNYFPKPITEVTGSLTKGYTKTTLNEIIFNIISLPINFNYTLLDKNGWNIYALSGISSGIVSNAVYDIDEVYEAPLSSRNNGVSSSQNIGYNPKIINRKTFDEGILNGGVMNNNIIISANTGVGVSKSLNDLISIYLQPVYQHNFRINGLGPNNDLTHRISLEIGTKIYLK